MTRRTLAGEIAADGVALHAGVRSHMVLKAAAPGTGIVFRRVDVSGSPSIPALWSRVGETRLGTVIASPDGGSVAVIEHLMAALAGAGIDDCFVDVDGPELPILDGDAASFLSLVESAGTREQVGEKKILHLRRAVEVGGDDAHCRLLPSERAEYSFDIDFESAAIGRQHYECIFAPEIFRREIAPARTFGFLQDAERLRAMGLGRGADLSNTLVLDGDALVNPHLQRFPDEFVRHKILDAIGDLKLAGYELVARFEGYRSSHTLNNVLLRALFADPTNYEWRDA